MGCGTFSPRQTAAAGQTQQEVCLVLDRSHSMCFDLSGVAWKYPKGIPAYPEGYGMPPHPVFSRWAALSKSVDAFVTVLREQQTIPRVGLVTWGSDMKTTPPFPATFIDSPLTTKLNDIVTPLQGRGGKIMWGATNMSSGIDKGRAVLTAADVNPLADKVMILMTDGQWNQGRDPLLAAAEARASGITIHTVCLLAGASEAVCRRIAGETGGSYSYAGNEAQLVAAFESLARQMKVMLIE